MWNKIDKLGKEDFEDWMRKLKEATSWEEEEEELAPATPSMTNSISTNTISSFPSAHLPTSHSEYITTLGSIPKPHATVPISALTGSGVDTLAQTLELVLSKQKNVEVKRFQFPVAMIGKVKSFLQKEYKAVTGDGITLSVDKDVEPSVLVQYLSRVRSQVTASQCFKIGGVKMDEIAAESEEVSNPDVKKLVGDGEDKFKGTKKPENYTVKKSEQEKK